MPTHYNEKIKKLGIDTFKLQTFIHENIPKYKLYPFLTVYTYTGLRVQPLQDHLMAKPLDVNLTMYYLLSMYRPPTVIPQASTTNCFKGSPSSHSPVSY